MGLGLFVGGLVPSLIFGVAFGNVLRGVPFRFDDTLRMTYEGNLFGLLNPFALLCGLVSVAMLVMHGGTYLALKTEAPVAARAAKAASSASIILIVLFTLAGLWVGFGLEGYVVIGNPDLAGPSNPLLKQTIHETGAWLRNYGRYPWMLTAPLLAYAAALAVRPVLARNRPGLAFIGSGIAVAAVIATAGLSLFPFLLPSSLDPRASLTVWDASSSRLTLLIMLAATLIFLPMVLAYTAWVYYVLRGKVTATYVKNSGASVY